jgi:hypothetical protein
MQQYCKRELEFLLKLYEIDYIYHLLAVCPQCYCGEIRQMLTFFTNLYCPKGYHSPDHSIRIVEYHRKNYP